MQPFEFRVAHLTSTVDRLLFYEIYCTQLSFLNEIDCIVNCSMSFFFYKEAGDILQDYLNVFDHKY